MIGNFNSLADEVHQSNVQAGWWSDPKTGERKDRNVGEMLMLVVSEVCEGADGLENDLMDDKLPQYPMLAVELADTNIRILDLVGFHKIDLDALLAMIGDHDSISSDDDQQALMRIVRHVAVAMEGNRKNKAHDKWPEFKAFDIGLAMAFRDAYLLAESYGWELDEIIAAKRAFNAQREDHKVENRLKPGGKAY